MSVVRHKHWAKDHPFYEQAPWCDLRTKKLCDERWSHTRRGEAVRFSREDWEERQRADALVASRAGQDAYARYTRSYARHVASIMEADHAS